MAHENSKKIKILVIVGTVREGRIGKTIADWYFTEAKKAAPNIEFELLDIKEQNLPLFNEPLLPMLHQYGDIQKKLAKTIERADGFVFITGEYNHSIPGSLKNFLDYIFAEWNYKAAAFVGYGGTGGVRAIEHLIQILAELKVTGVANSFSNIHVPGRYAFDENGNFKPETVRGDIGKQLNELSWWVHALKQARKERTT